MQSLLSAGRVPRNRADTPIIAESQEVRTVILGVHGSALNRTVHQLMNSPTPVYLEAEDNANLTDTFASGRCDSLAKWMDYQDLVCGVRLITFSDQGSCGSQTLGGSWSTTTPWEHCAGWPDLVDYNGGSFFPHRLRIWVR
ncbi:hypothetical protein [Sorangium sp. So ce1182]|uniref:hypothetical protein n=1 Tax=Sorangium sp. So ce1182 TaxID=3133334 RepID=UPI003F627EAD